MGGSMTGVGSSDLKRHLEGKRLTRGQAINAKCADCMRNYADGRECCTIPECPLYPYMPYNPAKTGDESSVKVELYQPEIISPETA